MATTWRIVYHWDDETIKKEKREFSLTDEIMELINSWWGWGWWAINWIKVNWQVVNPDQAWYVWLTIPQVINNLNSNSTTNALSAAQWKVLYEYIQALQHVWHFLALWNTATWLPVTNPQTSPYTYNTWDYYIVSNVAAQGWTNYKPNGSSYTINVASTTVESWEVQVNDLYFYDWYERRLLDNSWWGSSVAIDTSLSTTSTNPVQNQAIANAINNLSTDVNTKTFYLASAADFTNAQDAVDWIDAWKMALVCFNWQTYVYISKTSTKYTFEDINWYTTVNSNWSTWVFLNFLEITLDNGDVDDISISSKNQSSTIPSYLATWVNYSPVYTPEYNGSPATKKYVDDKFAAVPVYTAWSNINITSNQISTIRNWYVYVTCTDWAFVQHKTGTSAEGNYTPTEWDLVMVHFTQGCSVWWPDISIDGWTAIPFYIWVEGANAGNMYLASNNISKMFIYTNGRLVWDAVKDNNTVYAAGNWLTLTSWTFAIDPSVVATQSDLNNYATQTDLDDYLKTTDLHWWTGINIGPMSSHLPSGYQELESISATGTQYILTGITYTSWHTYEFNHKLFVDSTTDSSKWSWWNAWAGIRMYDDSWTLKYSWGWASSIIWNAGQSLDVTISVDNWTSTYEYTVGSTTSSLTRSNTSLSSYAGSISYPLFITTVNNGWWTLYTGSEMTATYYYFEAKDNNVLVRKMYPAKRLADNAIWMYDVVNDQFYTNSGTGTFIAWLPTGSWYNVEVDSTVWTDPTVRAGTWITITQWQSTRLPSWYTEVEYIQSDWACYIDTLVVSAVDDYVEQTFQKTGLTGTTCSWFGSWEWQSLIRVWIWSYTPSSQQMKFFCWSNATYQVADCDTSKHTIKFYKQNNKFYAEIDNEGANEYTLSGHETDSPTITSYLFARHWGTPQADTFDNEWTKIYYHLQKSMYNVTKMELIPCVRDSDDEPGFYDLVNERFLTNSWSWTLTAWPEVTFDPVRVISADASALTNTRTFFLASDSDTTTAQDAVNFRASWGNPIIMLDDCAYILNDFGIQRSADSASWEFRTTPNITDTTTKGYISNWRMVLEWSYDTQTDEATVSSISVYANMVKVEWGTHIWTTAPTSPYEGQLWYDTTNDVLKVYNGSAWGAVGWWWGVAITNVEVATSYSTAAKVWTTTAWNYVPAAWDLLLVNFVNGCGTTSAPTLAIDSGTAYGIRVGNTSATNTYFALWSTANSNVKVLMYFDWSYYKVWSTENKTYTSMTASTAETWTSTTANTISASVLKSAIQAHAITLDPSSPLTVTTIRCWSETQYTALTSKGLTTAYLCVEE